MALTCSIELKNPDDEVMAKKVKDFLLSLKDDPDIQLRYVYDKDEMKEHFRVAGPFDFIIESNRNISFSDRLNRETIWISTEPGDHKIGKATHGSRGDRKETTLFIASGPAVKKGVVIEKASMVDEAVTMAKMIGFDMPNTDGRILSQLLAD
jgi:predicted AlkP superfamily pyrophosphatase or phosphodiesterase